MSKSTSIPQSARNAVVDRSGGVCEGCGESRATNIHHRKYRSRGGTHEVHNLVALCGSGNTSGCHGRAHSGEGKDLGWAVPSWAHPEFWPAYRYDVGWVIYHDQAVEGQWWQPITEATASLLMSEGVT